MQILLEARAIAKSAIDRWRHALWQDRWARGAFPSTTFLFVERHLQCYLEPSRSLMSQPSTVPQPPPAFILICISSSFLCGGGRLVREAEGRKAGRALHTSLHTWHDVARAKTHTRIAARTVTRKRRRSVLVSHHSEIACQGKMDAGIQSSGFGDEEISCIRLIPEYIIYCNIIFILYYIPRVDAKNRRRLGSVTSMRCGCGTSVSRSDAATDGELPIPFTTALLRIKTKN